MSAIIEDIQKHWEAMRPVLSIRTEKDYDRSVKQLNALLDEVGTDESHPLYELLDTLAVVIQAYEEEHHQMPEVSGTEMLRYLMDEHALTQAELSEIGSQGVVSEILNEKRELNVRQIRALAKRFGVSPDVFI